MRKKSGKSAGKQRREKKKRVPRKTGRKGLIVKGSKPIGWRDDKE